MFNIRNIVFVCILFLGLFLRLYGNNWDQGWHLHPDERFLTMVGIDVKIPSSLSQYLDQHTSSFNPVNRGHSFYVYGTFPILLNKIIAQFFNNDRYDLFNLQGRVLSGVADFLILLIIYKLVALVEKKLKFSQWIKYLSSFFYAIAVLPIQLAHFYTVDTFVNVFCWLSLYFAVKIIMYSYNAKRITHNIQRKNGTNINVTRYTLHVLRNASLSGIFLGLAVACKVSAVYFAPLIGIFVFIGLVLSVKNVMSNPSAQCALSIPKGLRITKGKMYHSESFDSKDEESSEWNERKKSIFFVFFGTTCFLLFTYLALRVGSPYYFETSNILNPQLSTVYINNIQTLKSFENPLGLFPPAVQWIHAPRYLSLQNLIMFGVGPIYFLFSGIGLVLLLKKKNWVIAVSVFWVLLFLVFQSLQFAKTMRYLIFVYPFLAIFAAVGMFAFMQLTKKLKHVIRYTLHGAYFLMILVWPLAFMSIYMKDHSRVTASKWIYENIPSYSTISFEYWDDPLPLAVQDPTTRNYKGIEIHIFDVDTKEKWDIIRKQFDKVDYYVMSSNRGWGSLPKTPEHYPITSRFYEEMFKGKGEFKLIQEFSSYPSLRYLGIPLEFPDQWSEEAFTVYDHPLVYIFKKQ